MNTVRAISRISAVFVCIFALIFTAVPVFRVNAEEIETDTAASLTITLAPDNKPVQGAVYGLYRVADVTPDAGFSLLKSYRDAKMSVDVNNFAASNWRIAATTLNGYVAHKGIAPDYAAETDNNGIVVFSDLPCGLYLVKGMPVLSGSEYVIPTPFIVSLPSGNDTEWIYDVSINGKYTTHPESEDVHVEVLKVWRDEHKYQRPLEITVHLYNGTEFCDSVVLNKDNNWSFSWKNLPMGDWSVYEQNIPAGYLVSIEQQIYRYVVANFSPPHENPSTGTTEPPPDETTTRQDETTTEQDETTTGQDETTTSPDETTTEPPPERPPELPNTGQLWWPVPVLSLAGLMFVLVGFIGRKSEDE